MVFPSRLAVMWEENRFAVWTNRAAARA